MINISVTATCGAAISVCWACARASGVTLTYVPWDLQGGIDTDREGASVRRRNGEWSAE